MSGDSASWFCRFRVVGNQVMFTFKYTLEALWCRWFRKPRTFVFSGKRYRYFCHPCNLTFRNERAIEIPIMLEIVREHEGEEILEVGNCLSHYVPVHHEVVDKYEVYPGVINRDVVDFTPAKSFDLIISISTLEHLGFDEEVKDPEKPLRAIRHLTGLLRLGGLMVVTIPLGFNPSVDEMLERGRFRFTQRYCFKRLFPSHVWKEVGWEAIRGVGYGYEYKSAMGLVIGVIRKERKKVD